MAGKLNVGFGTTIEFADTDSIKFHTNQTSNCDWKVTADTALSPLASIKLSGLIIPACDKTRVITAQDTVLYALGDLQAQISCCCASKVTHVYDDGSGVVVVNNTDPLNPIVGFGGVFVDGVTITGDGSSAHPLVAVGGGVTAHAMTSIDGTITLTGTPATSLLQAVNLSVTSANITSSDGSVILGGASLGISAVLKGVDLTVNPAFITATIAQPDTQIVFGTGTSVSSSSNFTYNQNNPSNVLQMLDPNTGNPVLYVQTDDGTGNSYIQFSADNLASTGYYAQITESLTGVIQLVSYASSAEKAGINIDPNDVVGFPHGVFMRVDGFDKAQFTTDSLNLRKKGDNAAVVTYSLNFYELNINGSNFVGFKAPTTLAGDVTWILPNTDSTGTQALVSDGAGNLSWASMSGGTVTSVTATPPITSTGGVAPVISTLMNTSRLIGRTTAAAGVMEEIATSAAFSLTALTLDLVLVNGGAY